MNWWEEMFVKGLKVQSFLVMLVVGITSPTMAASFNCDKAQSKVEKLICSDAELSSIDNNLAKAYKDALAKRNSVEMEKLKSSQKYWLKHTRNVCDDLLCLKQAYSIRLSELVGSNSSLPSLSTTSSNQNEDFCKSVEKIISSKEAIKATASRQVTMDEAAVLKSSGLAFFDLPSDYSSGIEVIDIDNDGKQEVFAFDISGTGRYATMAAFDLPAGKNKSKPVHELFSGDAGVLSDPYFIRYGDKNYLVTSGDDGTGRIVSEVKRTGKTFSQILRCVSEVKTKVVSACESPACKALANRVTKNAKNEFTAEVWPHKYFAPFGLEVFAHNNPIPIDYDNSGTNRYLWKLGRKGYVYENLYWSWIGEGTKTAAPSCARPASDDGEPRDVIPGKKHDNLRRIIKQHEVLLRNNKILKPSETLPKDGEFFFLKYARTTYWVWGTGEEAAWGNSMHIILAKSGKSDYMGSVTINRSEALAACKKDCVRKIE